MSFTLSLTMEAISCYRDDCGITWAMPKEWIRDRRNDHKSFYCPNGHQQHYVVKSDAEKAREERDRAKREATRLQARLDQVRADRDFERRSKAAIRGHLTRLKKRIAAGVCPCCRRPFSSVMQHMRRQHPEFVEKWGLEKEVSQ